MNIQRIETFSNEFVCLVRVTTESGAHGWGQVAENVEADQKFFGLSEGPVRYGYPTVDRRLERL